MLGRRLVKVEEFFFDTKVLNFSMKYSRKRESNEVAM